VLSAGEEEAEGKAGCSSTAERKALFDRFLQIVPAEKIRAFVADREFISAEWLGFLAGRDVPFVIRIRSSRKVSLGETSSAEKRPARTFFQDMASFRTWRSRRRSAASLASRVSLEIRK
jgi:hypothetical protein